MLRRKGKALRGLDLRPIDRGDTAFGDRTPIDHQLIYLGGLLIDVARTNVERLRNAVRGSRTRIIRVRNLKIALCELIRTFRVRAGEHLSPVKCDLRHDTVVIPIEPALDLFSVEYVGGVVQVQKASEIGPCRISPVWNFYVTIVDPAWIVVRVATDVSGREERQRNVVGTDLR